MINIAVMISGHPKGFDLTHQYFEHWNTLYEDVNFDFFISVWENDYDTSIFDWTTKYEFLKESECPYDLSNHESLAHQPHYCYALHKVNELRNSYNKKYDSVIQTRADAIFSRSLLDILIGKLTNIRGGLIPEKDNQGNFTGKSIIDERPDPQISDKNILSANGSVIHNSFNLEKKLLIQNLWTQDVWFMGTPKVMDIFCNMFNYIYIEKKYQETLMLHIFQAEYLNQMGIYNTPTQCGNSFTFVREKNRFNFDHRGGGYPLEYPSPDQLKRLIVDKGLDWIYDNDDSVQRWKQVQDYFRETEK
jgi:hypothetical protein